MPLVACPKCNKRCSDRAKQCPQCGHTFGATIACADCRHQNDASARTCAECGGPLADSGDSIIATPGVSRRTKVVIVAGASVAVVALVVVLIVNGSKQSAAKTSSKGDVASTGTPTSASSSAVNTAAAGAPTATAEQAPAKPVLPPWIEVRVQRVQVAATDTSWDGPRDQAGEKDQCNAVAALAAAAGPEIGAPVAGFCTLFTSNAQRQTNPTDPDLQLVLSARGVEYKSYIAFDQASYTFDYPFAIPTNAIDDDGFSLAVVDNDTTSENGQQIGSVRIDKSAMASALESGRLITPTVSKLDVFEISIKPYDGNLQQAVVTLNTKDGSGIVSGFEVAAGDIVRVEASGSWQIGTKQDDIIGPAGYPRTGGLDAFKEYGLGGSVALIGSKGSVLRVPPGDCFRAVAPYAGTVWVGINDKLPADNRGTIEFHIYRRGPSAATWRRPGVPLPCD